MLLRNVYAHEIAVEFLLKVCLCFAIQAVSDKLMAGFVECLDNEEAEEGTEKEDGKTDIPCLL